jgi:hypothetical protein
MAHPEQVGKKWTLRPLIITKPLWLGVIVFLTLIRHMLVYFLIMIVMALVRSIRYPAFPNNNTYECWCRGRR